MTSEPYILHYAPDNASLVIRLALEELGVEYRTTLVDRRIEAQKSNSYLALNPNGLIPVLETPEGPIFETAAVLLWLSDRHQALAPLVSDADRADFLKWLFFLSNTLHPALRHTFYASKYIGDDKRDQQQLRAVASKQIIDHLTVLEARWNTVPQPPIALELYLIPMLRWLALYPAASDRSWFRIHDYQALFVAAKELESRASVQAASLAEGLGPRPFTSPTPPNPPEGSAT